MIRNETPDYRSLTRLCVAELTDLFGSSDEPGGLSPQWWNRLFEECESHVLDDLRFRQVAALEVATKLVAVAFALNAPWGQLGRWLVRFYSYARQAEKIGLEVPSSSVSALWLRRSVEIIPMTIDEYRDLALRRNVDASTFGLTDLSDEELHNVQDCEGILGEIRADWLELDLASDADLREWMTAYDKVGDDLRSGG